MVTTNLHQANFTTPSKITGLTTAKGDIISGDATSGLTSTTVGVNDTVLTADSSTSSGIKWSTPTGGLFIGHTDTPGAYTGTAARILAVNSGETAVEFSNNQNGTNSDTTGGSIAFGVGSSISALGAIAIGSSATADSLGAISLGEGTTTSGTRPIAIGVGATATGTRPIAIGRSASATVTESIALGNGANVTGIGSIAFGNAASCNVTNSLTMSNLPLINNTSATGVTFGVAAWPGTNSVIVTATIAMTDAIGTVTLTLPTNTVMLVDQIDVFKIDTAATVTGAGTFTLGSDAGSASFVAATSIGFGAENVLYGRQTYSSLANVTGTNTLIFARTVVPLTVSAGTYNVRIIFEGKLIRIE